MRCLQVILNAWCVVEFIREVSGYGSSVNMTVWGNRRDPSLRGFQLGWVIWVRCCPAFPTSRPAGLHVRYTCSRVVSLQLSKRSITIKRSHCVRDNSVKVVCLREVHHW